MSTSVSGRKNTKGKSRNKKAVSRRKKRMSTGRIVLISVLVFLIFLIGGIGIFIMRLMNRVERIDNSTVETLDPATASIPIDLPPISGDESMPDWVLQYLYGEDTPPETTHGADDPTETQPDNTEESTSEAPTEPTAPPTTTTAFDWGNIQSIQHDGFYNVLLVGQDRRPGEGRQRSDTMILLSMNRSSGKVSMVSFLRDLYVNVPGYGKTRLSHAYWYGGFPLLYSAFKENFGLTIDGGVEADFNGFQNIVNALGGVTINLTADEAEIVFKDRSKSGDQYLDGAHALEYARIRKIGTDFGRTSRQRTVLMALFNKAKAGGAGGLMNALNAALPYVSTDMSNGKIMEIAACATGNISSLSISTYSVPMNGDYYGAYINGMDILVPNLPAVKYHLRYKMLPF